MSTETGGDPRAESGSPPGPRAPQLLHRRYPEVAGKDAPRVEGRRGDGGTDGQEPRRRGNRQKGPGRSPGKDSRGREEGRGGKGGERGGSGQREGERHIKGRRGDRWTPDRETGGLGGAAPREGTEGERKDGDVWEEMDRWTVRPVWEKRRTDAGKGWMGTRIAGQTRRSLSKTWERGDRRHRRKPASGRGQKGLLGGGV